MRNELKMILAGFGAGAIVGAIALTAGGAAIDSQQMTRGDRLMAARRTPIEYGETNAGSRVEIIAPVGSAVEFKDPRGRVVYRSDPGSQTTTVAKSDRIPSLIVRQHAADLAEPAHIAPTTPDAGGSTTVVEQ